MAMITTHVLPGNANYTSNRYPVIKAFELAIPYVYQDKAKGTNSGYATIGVGFLVSANAEGILEGIDPDLRTNLGLSVDGYDNLVTAIENATNNVLFTSDAAAQTAIQDAINGVLASAANYEIPNPEPSFTMQYSSDPATADSQMHATFDLIVDRQGGYENQVDQWLNGDPANSTSAIPDSRERLALLSLAYNGLIGFEKNAQGIPKQYSNGTYILKSPSLRQAMLNGDRAEAWYEIRYNSNLDGKNYLKSGIAPGNNIDKGIAKRRYAESEIFGLFDNADSVGDADAKGAYRAYTRHREYIDKYEAAYGVGGTRGDQIAEANNYGITFNGTALDVSGLQAELTDAYDYLTKTYITDKGIGITVDWQNILVGEDNGSNGTTDTRYYRSTDIDVLTSSDNSDLIFGDSGNDVIQGGLGTDVLYGGSGVDIYKYRPGDGADVIVDYAGGPNATFGDGKGAILYDPEGTPQFSPSAPDKPKATAATPAPGKAWIKPSPTP